MISSIFYFTLSIFLLPVLLDMSMEIFPYLLEFSPDKCFLFHQILPLLFNKSPGKPFVHLHSFFFFFDLLLGTSTLKASCSDRDQAWPLTYFKRFLARFEVLFCCSFNSINFHFININVFIYISTDCCLSFQFLVSFIYSVFSSTDLFRYRYFS